MKIMDREKVKYSIERCICHVPDACRDCAYDAGHPYNECVEMMLRDALAMLKEQELPTELKQKMWNALYAEEDEYEKKFVGKEEHLNWFTVYRPWLQKGFDIAINAIADWERR